MADPKYTPKNGGLYHSDGYRIPDDEPLMILRGKDIGALDAICEYVEMLKDQPKNKTTISHLRSSLERLEAFYKYQKENPELQSVGCSRKNHDTPSRFLIRAKLLIKETRQEGVYK